MIKDWKLNDPENFSDNEFKLDKEVKDTLFQVVRVENTKTLNGDSVLDMYCNVAEGPERGKTLRHRFFNTGPSKNEYGKTMQGGRSQLRWLLCQFEEFYDVVEEKKIIKESFIPQHLVSKKFIADTVRNNKYINLTKYRAQTILHDEKVNAAKELGKPLEKSDPKDIFGPTTAQKNDTNMPDF